MIDALQEPHQNQKPVWAWFLGWGVLIGTFIWFAFSRLAFSPVPWPDGSAFYLPSVDLFQWPPHWRMHAQAAFVPTYDTANFNTMPLLPFVLGAFSRLGLTQLFGTPLAIKLVSLVALIGCAAVLWTKLGKVLGRVGPASAVALAVLWDPVLRWGTLVVRSETWIGWIWILILLELVEFQKKRKSFWVISTLLALGAYIHFEAVFLVPPTMVGLWEPKERWRESLQNWWKNLLQVGGRTSVLLLPWGFYVLSQFPLFLSQMDTQFHRLGRSNYWISNPYLLFHSLFLELGSPASLPKFFNLAKGLFWLLIILLTVLVGWFALSALFSKAQEKFQLENRRCSDSRGLVPFFAAGTAFWMSFYLWCTKPEVWFITLCHIFLWAWVGVAILSIPGKAWRYFMASSAGVYAILSLLGNLGLQRSIHPSYSWDTYRQWVSCVERTIGLAANHEAPRVWQPHVPDVLVELSDRHPDWDLTRTLDFENLREKAEQFGQNADAILLSRFFNPRRGEVVASYEGLERPSDQRWVSQEEVHPFGPWVVNQLPVLQPDLWERRVCQVGPFFADVAIKKRH